MLRCYFIFLFLFLCGLPLLPPCHLIEEPLLPRAHDCPLHVHGKGLCLHSIGAVATLATHPLIRQWHRGWCLRHEKGMVNDADDACSCGSSLGDLLAPLLTLAAIGTDGTETLQ